MENRLLKSFGSVDKVPLIIGEAGFIAQPCNYLIATQSIDQEFVKPELERLMSQLGSHREQVSGRTTPLGSQPASLLSPKDK